MKYDWITILDRAAALHAQEFALVGTAPTLRRLHYKVVSDPACVAAGYVNTLNLYKQFSDRTARAREAGTFPDLSDESREILHAAGSTGLPDIAATARWYAQNHTLRRDLELPVQVVLIAEKEGQMPSLASRFAWLPRTYTKGFNSVTHMRRVAGLNDHRRRTVGLYLGDYDPSGLDITRDLAAKVPFEVQRALLTWDQVQELDLPPLPAKANDSRSARMMAEHGRVVQVEVEALDTQVALDIVAKAIEDVAEVTLRPDGLPDLPEVDRAEADQRDQLMQVAGIVADALGGDHDE